MDGESIELVPDAFHGPRVFADEDGRQVMVNLESLRFADGSRETAQALVGLNVDIDRPDQVTGLSRLLHEAAPDDPLEKLRPLGPMLRVDIDGAHERLLPEGALVLQRPLQPL